MDIKARAVAIFEKHFKKWESNPDRMTSGYNYESTYADMMGKIEKEVLQISVGNVPKDKNLKKKLHTRFGKIELNKSHVLGISPTTMDISSLAQETMCCIGQYLVFSEAEEVINNLTSASINAKQVERVCHQYGQWIENQDCQAIKEEVYKEHTPKKANEVHYVSVDGAMYLTREESWKESKLGRIYQSKDIVQVSEGRSELVNSTYVTHLRDNKEFIPKMDYHLADLNKLVFIADGARWIWKWIGQSYPESIQIVDYFHAKEHLCEFAKLYHKDEKQYKEWVRKQSETMLNKGITPVIEAINRLPEQKKRTVAKRKGSA